MPELPEVETIRRGLQRSIVNQTIKSVDVRLPKIIAIGPGTVSNIRRTGKKAVAKFRAAIAGQKFVSIKRRGKLLILDLSGPWTLLVHLKMTGQLIFAKKSELPKTAKIFNKPDGRRLKLPHKYTHLVFRFKNGAELYYNDMRQFGHVRLVHDDELGRVREFSEYGPEPLTSKFDFAYFQERAKKSSVAIKLFLMNPKVVAGIGNIYSDEILYCAGVRPSRKTNQVNEKELKKIFACIPKILKRAVKLHGSSVGDYFRADGSEGTFGREHKAYGRAGQKCSKCGTILKKVKLGGRTSSYCPKCQK